MESLETQVERHWQAFLSLGNDLERFRFAVALRQANLTLFHRFLADHIEAVMPIVYTPTVGAAIQRFSLDYRTPSGGVFLAAPDLERIDSVLSQAAAILVAYGTTKSTALAATTGITAAIAAARLGGGLMVDRMSVPVVAATAQAIALGGAVLLTLVPTPEMAIPTLGMIGIGYGLISGVTAGAVALYWPKALFGQTASRIYIAWCLAALTLPVVAARLFDLTGGYHTAIMLAGAANLCGVVVGLTLPRQTRRV